MLLCLFEWAKEQPQARKRAHPNIEVHWLLYRLQPNYHSISDFRRINPQTLRSNFKLFVLFFKDVELVVGETVAIDGTIIGAHNSKKSNYNQKKIDRHLAYIESITNEYLQELEENDQKD